MRNEFKTTIELKRIEICDLLLACLAAYNASGHEAQKWMDLHDKLKSQLHELDNQLDMVIKSETF